MNSTLQIESFVTIRDNKVIKNHDLIFESKEIKSLDFLNELYKQNKIQYSKFFKMDKLSKLGFLATELLIHEDNAVKKLSPYQIAVVLSNKNSSLDNDLKYFESTKNIASPSLFVYTLPNIVIGEICIRNGFKGENFFFIGDVFDAELIKESVNLAFMNTDTQCCFCGWVDAYDETCEAIIFKVGKNKNESTIDFTIQNLLKLNNNKNGSLNS